MTRHDPQPYLDKAKYNEAFGEFLIDGHAKDFVDWAFTALFYSAIHYVNAYLVREHLPLPRNHAERLYLIAQHLPEAFQPYRRLKHMSEALRYEIRTPSRTMTNDAKPALRKVMSAALKPARGATSR